MDLKITLLFVCVVSIQIVYSVPITEGVTGVLNTGARGSGPNPNGLLVGLGGILDEPLCGLGLGCDECDGPLSGLQPTLDPPVKSLGLGVDCPGRQGSGNGGKGGKGGSDDCDHGRGGHGHDGNGRGNHGCDGNGRGDRGCDGNGRGDHGCDGNGRGDTDPTCDTNVTCDVCDE